MSDYPSWDRKREYLAEAQAAMGRVAADVDADTTNVWQSIDSVIAELHKLRSAASSEQRTRYDAMVARMEAEDAARRARPAEPTPEVVSKVRQLVELGIPISARLELRQHTSMSPAEATAFVDALAGSREGVTR